MTTPNTVRYIRNKKVAFQEIDNATHILDEKNDAIITLNATATELWRALAKKSTLDSLTTIVMSTFAVSRKQAQTDVKKYLARLQKFNLISKL